MQLAIVAAGFTPGEADQLRRSMAAWRRKGGLEHFEQRLVDGMRRAATPRNSRGRSTSRSWASANTAFPNRIRRPSRCSFTSRRGSSATSRRRSPARCSTPSRWASTRRRSSCRMRAGMASTCGRADVTVSDWDCTLEIEIYCGRTHMPANGLPLTPRAALGLRIIGGLTEAGAHASSPRDGRRRSRAWPISRIARSSTAATWPASPTPTRSRRSPGIATTPSGTSPASSGCRRCSQAHVRGSRSRACRRRPKARTSSPTIGLARSRCAVIRSRSCAASCSERRVPRPRDRRNAARTLRPHRGHRHRPAAARYRERRRLRHARGRDGRHQRDRLARSRRPPAPRAAGRAAARGLRQGGARGPGRARARGTARRSFPDAGHSRDALAGLH